MEEDHQPVAPGGVPRGAADLTAAWLTEALADAAGRAEVVDVASRPVGTGQVAETRRLSLTWEPAGAGPSAVIAKVPSPDPASRAAATAVRTYEIEAGFYRDVAPTVDVRAPACWCTRWAPETDDYVVLLEDLAPAEQGDQLGGCSVDQAASALRELVALHAPRWGDATLLDLPWLDGVTPERAQMLAALLAALLPGFIDTFTATVSPEVMSLAERFVPRSEDYLLGWHGPTTVTHGDFRLDNLLFGGPRVGVVDWQTVGVGAAVGDVAYFLGGSLRPDVRAAHEDELVREYHDRLRAAGVDQSWDDCWRGYRRGAFGGLLMAIFASQVVQRTERGDAMFTVMAEHAGRHALDLGAEDLLA